MLCYQITLPTHVYYMCTRKHHGNCLHCAYPLKSHGMWVLVSTWHVTTSAYLTISTQKRTASILQTLSTSTLQIYWRVDVLGTLLYAVKPLYSKCLKLRITLVFQDISNIAWTFGGSKDVQNRGVPLYTNNFPSHSYHQVTHKHWISWTRAGYILKTVPAYSSWSHFRMTSG